MKLLIGIPAFNEEQMIGKAIRTLPRKIEGIDRIDVLVLNDGSTDRSAEVASDEGALVINHIINRGLGGALKSIFTYAVENEYDILVTFDADGQHDGSDIKRLIQPILDEKKDVIIGTRWTERKRLTFSRYLINFFANIVTYLLFGIYTTDSQSGLRAFNKKAIKNILITSEGMEVSSEFFKEIKKNKLHFSEIPIKAIYTDYSLEKGQRVDNAPEVLLRLIIRFLR